MYTCVTSTISNVKRFSPRVALCRCIGHRDVMIDEDYDDEEHYSKDRGAHGAYGVYPTQATNVFGGYRGKEIAYHPRYFSNFMPQRRLGYRLQVRYKCTVVLLST